MNRPVAVLPARAFVAALLVVAGTSAGPALAQSPDAAAASLMIEVTADEGKISVAEAFQVEGGPAGIWTMPLVLPESGYQPRMVERVGDEPGLVLRASGGAAARIRDGAVVVSGAPGTAGEFVVEVHYEVPVADARLVLAATPQMDLARVQVIHRGGPHALQVRPLAAFSFREESEGAGTWRTQELLDPVPAGGSLRIAVGRLPSGSGPYRSAGVAVLLAVAAGAVVLGIRRRQG